MPYNLQIEKLPIQTSRKYWKPAATPLRSIPYRLKERAAKVSHNMAKQDIQVERPIDETAPCASNKAITLNPNLSIITTDTRNVNKAIP